MDAETRKALREVAAGKLEGFTPGELEDIGLEPTGSIDDDDLMEQAERLLAGSLTFALTITLGSAAMQTNEDVADALHRIADQVQPAEFGLGGGKIRDRNGNTVGDFGFAGEAI